MYQIGSNIDIFIHLLHQNFDIFKIIAEGQSHALQL